MEARKKFGGVGDEGGLSSDAAGSGLEIRGLSDGTGYVGEVGVASSSQSGSKVDAPCLKAIGGTTCGYPIGDRAHWDRTIPMFHAFEASPEPSVADLDAAVGDYPFGGPGRITEVPSEGVRSGVELIAAERRRQIDVEGWISEHDDEHTRGQLANAAMAYTRKSLQQAISINTGVLPPPEWPWMLDWWKPSPDPIRNLVKAGALIAAEIDRLQRKVK